METVLLEIMNTTTLGQRLKQARESAGMKQRDLGKRAGVSESAISQWESGTIEKIAAGRLAAVASVLNVSLDWLLSGDRPSDPGNADCGQMARFWPMLTLSQRADLERQAQEMAEHNEALLRELGR